MATHRHIDRICCGILAATLLITILFINGEALGLTIQDAGIGYESRLFDTSTVHTIDIVMDDWEEFLETCEDEEYAACTVIIDGEAYSTVGIRAKGNTSLSSVQAYGNDRYSFKIEFDHYDSSQSYYGLDKISLNNCIQDNTYMKDYLAYTLMGEFGVASPLCSYVYITVNGEDWGLYLAVEAVEESFLQRNYGDDAGELYKPDSISIGGDFDFSDSDFDFSDFEDFDSSSFNFSGTDFSGSDTESADFSAFDISGADFSDFDTEQFDAGADFDPASLFSGSESTDTAESSAAADFDFDMDFDSLFSDFSMGSEDVKLQYTDDDPESYSNIFDNAKTDITQEDQQRLIASLQTLDSDAADTVVDVESVIRYFVVHNFLVNDDSYTGMMVHNYYLYEEDGVLSMIPWDYNLAFGGFSASTDGTDAINTAIDFDLEDRPMVDWIFSSEEYTELYHTYYQEFVSTFYDSGCLAELIQETYELIAPYVEEDPTAFCTYEEFETAVDTLQDFCSLRFESIQGQLDGTIPCTDAGQQADSSSLIDGSSVDVSAMGSMDNSMNSFPTGGGDFGEMPDGDFDFSDLSGEFDFSSIIGTEGDAALPDSAEIPDAADTEEAADTDTEAETGGDSEEDSAEESADAAISFDADSFDFPQSSTASAGTSSTFLWLGISILILLGGLLFAFRFRR